MLAARPAARSVPTALSDGSARTRAAIAWRSADTSVVRGSPSAAAASSHPSLDTVETLGGVKRFFSTYVHEVEFDRSKLTSDKKIQKVVEDTHVLIETDGERFRILEVGTKHDSPLFDVNDVPADKGTPWISAN